MAFLDKKIIMRTRGQIANNIFAGTHFDAVEIKKSVFNGLAELVLHVKGDHIKFRHRTNKNIIKRPPVDIS